MRPHLLNAKLTFDRLNQSNDKWELINDQKFKAQKFCYDQQETHHCYNAASVELLYCNM